MKMFLLHGCSSIFISLIKIESCQDAMGNGCLLRTTLQWIPHTRICQCWNSGFSVWRRPYRNTIYLGFSLLTSKVVRFSHASHHTLYTFLFQCAFTTRTRLAQSGVCFHHLPVCSHPGFYTCGIPVFNDMCQLYCPFTLLPCPQPMLLR